MIGRHRTGSPAWIVIAAAAIALQAAAITRGQLATADRLQEPGWWPTKGTPARSEYAGAAACAECHRAQSSSQGSTSMARTAARLDASAQTLTRARPGLAFSTGGYTYQIASDGHQPTYRVSRGDESSSATLTWGFGAGTVGESFLFERPDGFHEARVSYFASIDGLGITPGRAIAVMRGIDEAMARRVDETELRRCFGCHTTAPTAGGRFDPSSAIPGITCEACHGPGRLHAEAMKLSQREGGDAPLLNPARLTPQESVDFCGACHSTFWDIKLSDDKGMAAMRAQPYRLQLSRCWKARDTRLTCTACHDPHRPLVTEARPYDDRCLSCHLTKDAAPSSDRTVRACPVGIEHCVTCHMPKYDVPEMHHAFTDHRIQVPARRP